MMCVHVQDGKTCLEIALDRRHVAVIEHLCGLRVKTLVISTNKVSEILHVLPERQCPWVVGGCGLCAAEYDDACMCSTESPASTLPVSAAT